MPPPEEATLTLEPHMPWAPQLREGVEERRRRNNEKYAPVAQAEFANNTMRRLQDQAAAIPLMPQDPSELSEPESQESADSISGHVTRSWNPSEKDNRYHFARDRAVEFSQPWRPLTESSSRSTTATLPQTTLPQTTLPQTTLQQTTLPQGEREDLTELDEWNRWRRVPTGKQCAGDGAGVLGASVDEPILRDATRAALQLEAAQEFARAQRERQQVPCFSPGPAATSMQVPTAFAPASTIAETPPAQVFPVVGIPSASAPAAAAYPMASMPPAPPAWRPAAVPTVLPRGGPGRVWL